jgi:hypothetical protein
MKNEGDLKQNINKSAENERCRGEENDKELKGVKETPWKLKENRKSMQENQRKIKAT